MKNINPILIAEDNQHDAELTLAALSGLNLANFLVVVKDGVEVMEYLCYEGKYSNRKKANPVVILLDIKMPRMDGLEVLQLIRSNPALKLIPVVMLTSSREEFDLHKCYKQGVNAYVVKPVEYKEFFDSVKQLGIFWALINEMPPENEK